MKVKKEKLELTILMPCLNEEETIAICIEKAKKFLKRCNINGEILISNNGSTDNSVKIAKEMGARVCNEDKKGYGCALRKGTKEAKGKYIIMGDCDDSYDFLKLDDILEKLREGYQLVMGNRFEGGIEKGAMSFSHQYIGNPLLSKIGRILYKTDVKDFHCGLRGYDREAFLKLDLQSDGMEYASEMVVAAVKNRYSIAQVPIKLKKDGRSKPSHLRSIRDGLRHLRFLIKNLK